MTAPTLEQIIEANTQDNTGKKLTFGLRHDFTGITGFRTGEAQFVLPTIAMQINEWNDKKTVQIFACDKGKLPTGIYLLDKDDEPKDIIIGDAYMNIVVKNPVIVESIIKMYDLKPPKKS